ncbi:MAG TPA: phosphotransferase [Chthonomonadaceae bacterium]|nr:phosphotransferase [Chthonomonadaceae bacterium]
MGTGSFVFPDMQTLTEGIFAVFRASGHPDARLSVLGRQSNIYTSTFPSEIVTCCLEDGRPLRLLCKHARGKDYSAYQHKYGPIYEAEVYRRVLQPLQASVPRSYGLYEEETTGRIWLVLEYLEDCLRVVKAPEPGAMRLAARWIGQFHAANAARLQREPLPFLNVYNAEYYIGWARRTAQFAGNLHHDFPWLSPFCRRAEEILASLTALPLTVIHGEYYPANILYREGTIYPVDWESAALAVGEIDLASLAHGWSLQDIEEYSKAYQQARWPAGTPPDFERTFDITQLYWCLRWLGDRPEWTTHRNWQGQFKRLLALGERLELI